MQESKGYEKWTYRILPTSFNVTKVESEDMRRDEFNDTDQHRVYSWAEIFEQMEEKTNGSRITLLQDFI